MRVSFILPEFSVSPVGGYKVVYKYAQYLRGRGHQVKIIHPLTIERENEVSSIVAAYVYFKTKIIKTWEYPDSLTFVPTLSEKFIPPADVIVATSWKTAEWVRNYSTTKGEKYYLIHDYEFFETADDQKRNRMISTYKSGMNNIATSYPVVEMLKKVDAPILVVVPVGIDFTEFNLIQPVESVQRTMIGFPYRRENFKGTHIAIAALGIVRKEWKGKSLNFWTFGHSAQESTPTWVQHYGRINTEKLNLLYNNSSIFVVPSFFEGWGLPGSEAMACGASLVSTQNGGVLSYAKHGVNSLLSKPGDIDGIAQHILDLLNDDSFRIRLGLNGYQSIHRFSVEESCVRLEHVLLSDHIHKPFSEDDFPWLVGR